MEKVFKSMVRAVLLKSDIFEEARKTPELSSHAAVIIFISGIAAGIGSVGRIGIPGLILGTFGAIASWVVWVGLIYLVSILIFPSPQKNDFSIVDFLRVMGFAASPGIIRAGGIISPLYFFLTVASYLWMIAAIAVSLKAVSGYRSLSETLMISAGTWVVMYFTITILLSSRVF